MVKIEGTEEEVAHPSTSAMNTSSAPFSSHHHQQRQPTFPSSPPYAAPPDSPDTCSSVSSDHTFHGFSPRSSPTLRIEQKPPSPTPSISPDHKPSSPEVPQIAATAVVNRLNREEPTTVTKMESGAETGFANSRGDDGDGGRRRQQQPSSSRTGRIMSTRSDKMVKSAALGLRVCELAVCLIAFSVMASDKNRGWALDSFDRYIEFRYSLSISVIGFAYSTFQGISLIHQLSSGNHQISQHQLFRYYFDFAMDQILAYLLLSASSSAATRVDDWISNWGKDKFPTLASASTGMSFLAFAAFAFSSLISGYILCTCKSTS